jgi:3D (Asp-Asp-Asp) domain-containing protein
MKKYFIIFLTFFTMFNGYIWICLFEDYKDIYKKQIEELQNENTLLREQVAEIKLEGMNVTVTMYHPTRYQTDSTPNILADGTRITVHRASEYKYIAVSRNLLKRWGGWLDYGDFVVLKGTDGKDGVYQVKDTMNKRFVNRIDILETPGTKPYKFENAKITKTHIDETDFEFVTDKK